MKKIFSYLSLLVGVTITLLFLGCGANQFNMVKPANHVLSSTKDSVHVSLRGDVADFQYEYFLQTLLYMEQRNVKSLHIHLFTPGGSAVSMIAITDVLETYKEKGIHITTYANGACLSAGVPIFLMGDVRIMRPNAQLMIHPMGGLPHKESVNSETWAVFEAWKYVYIDILTRVTKITGKEALAMLTGSDKDDLTWFGAFEALKLGFATDIK